MKGGVVLLAAGCSQRFGSDKRKWPLTSSHSLVVYTALRLAATGLPVAVILRAGDFKIAQVLRQQGVSVRLLANTGGLGDSLAQAVRRVALPAGWDFCLVHLGDMPAVSPSTLMQLIARASSHRIVRPQLRGKPGHPVCFGRRWFYQLAKLSGDEGARSLLEANVGAVTNIQVTDAGVTFDIDTPADADRFKRLHTRITA